MSTKLLAMAMVALLFSSCQRERKQDASSSDVAPPVSSARATAGNEETQGAAAARPELRPQSASIELGYSANEAGAVIEGVKSRRFLAGLSFVLAIRTADLGEGAMVSVRWKDANGQELAAETKRPSMGQAFLDFANPDTTQWAAGSYRVEVESAGNPLGKIEFEVFRTGGSGG